MNDQEKSMLHAILDKDPQSAMSHFKVWSASVSFDDMEGGSNRLVPLLYKRISGIQPDFPYKNRMKGVYRYYLYKNRLQLHNGQAVMKALDQAGIDFMLLKGSALIAAYYDSPALRPMNDIDLLVKKQDAEKAYHLLSELGWKKQRNRDFHQTFHSTQSIDLKRADNMKLDLHWNVIYQVNWEGSDKLYWEQSEQVVYDDRTISILKPELQILHNMAHGLRWNTMSSIRWIPDVMLILEKRRADINWDHFLVLAKDRRLVYTLRYGLTLLSQEFGAEIPPGFMEKLQSIPVSRAEKKLHQAMSQPSRFDMFKAHWQIYMLTTETDPYWRRLIKLPDYLTNLIGCETYRQAFAFAFKKLWKRITNPGKSAVKPNKNNEKGGYKLQ